ncbi:hypothetical protein A3F55_00795 [Candidatus Adlerbacteria bacterium RIFCSPHIGHO2_12_FULL_53_18]|uniref:Uncharacterized protein n=1 Tax=Candidatus Adlerbacteria bacterium RIFCSPHIGHO2_12_FULL_53_18 TaxID=1797242 RepID=A0A1F4XRC7_9BACT|nr:MAG: hypothetical protein A3F55_00795 [Candidatus Adlerbacteria bacterium RIFCSPHIGHO2_12_FULL_53_18]
MNIAGLFPAIRTFRRGKPAPTPPRSITPNEAHRAFEQAPTLEHMEQLHQAIAPRTLPLQMLEEGSPNHSHKWRDLPWDQNLGESFTDEDPIGQGNRFPMATYKTLVECSCGARAIESKRALI